VKQVAELLGVAPSTVVNYADQGRLKHWRLPSGQRRFRRRDIEPFMAPPLDEPEEAVS
jgi:excisionase family DNA binding protein